jgi:hypothetical protein
MINRFILVAAAVGAFIAPALPLPEAHAMPASCLGLAASAMQECADCAAAAGMIPASVCAKYGTPQGNVPVPAPNIPQQQAPRLNRCSPLLTPIGQPC